MLLRTMLSLAAVAALLVPSVSTASEAQDQAMVDLGAPVAAQSLDEYRGREDSRLRLNLQDTDAEIKDTIVAHNRSGHNFIGGGSFKDSVGFPMVMQNTGNGVIMQNAVIITIDLNK